MGYAMNREEKTADYAELAEELKNCQLKSPKLLALTILSPNSVSIYKPPAI